MVEELHGKCLGHKQHGDLKEGNLLCDIASEKTGHLALDDMRCSMCKESKKHLLVSIFTKELAFSSFFNFLSIAPDRRLPAQILFSSCSRRHIFATYYVQENTFYMLRGLT